MEPRRDCGQRRRTAIKTCSNYVENRDDENRSGTAADAEAEADSRVEGYEGAEEQDEYVCGCMWDPWKTVSNGDSGSNLVCALEVNSSI